MTIAELKQLKESENKVGVNKPKPEL